MARESPTRIRSTPPRSAMRAVGASYAVTITSGVLPVARLRDRTAGTVPCCPMSASFPSSATRLPAVTRVYCQSRGARVRELRRGGRRARRRAPALRGARVVGQARVDDQGRGDRALVLLLPLALPTRADRGGPGAVIWEAAGPPVTRPADQPVRQSATIPPTDEEHLGQMVPRALRAHLDH